jgi:hypothetical protein
MAMLLVRTSKEVTMEIIGEHSRVLAEAAGRGENNFWGSQKAISTRNDD